MMETTGNLTKKAREKIDFGFREVGRSDKLLVLDRFDMPWLPEEKQGIPLGIITLQDGGMFYFASAIRGKDLQKAARELKPTNTEANKAFYAAIQRFLNGEPIKILDHPKTKAPEIPHERQRDIFYASNGRGATRTYFMRMDDLDDKPVILRIAACTGKGSEINVLSVLTTEDVREITRRCLGK